MSVLLKKWVTREVDEAQVRAVADALAVSAAVARVLVGRGYVDPQEADRFLNPRLSNLEDPFRLPGMAVAVERIWAAIDAGESICVFGDYDVDGVSSVALLSRVFSRLGARVRHFLPSRFEHGYGLRAESLAECLAQCAPSLMVTVDCGTSSCEAVAAARKAGVDVVVTDHHEPGGAVADAVAVVNPKLGAEGDLAQLAGVGVAFKLCHALVKRGLDQDRPAARRIDLREYLDLVALGTVADIVPLLGENRILVRHGLARLSSAPSVGIQALLSVAGLKGAVDVYHIGFGLGPRLNAAGRLGSAESALALLLTDSPDEALRVARELNESNEERKRIEDSIRKEAELELDGRFDPATHFGLVAARDGWHVGTIGIVASRLVSRFYRPSVVIGFDADGMGAGSCRSIAELNMVEALGECAELLETFGGHRMAAGLSVRRENLTAFEERFNAACMARLRGLDLRPVQTVDAWISLGEADERLFNELQALQPLGMGNPRPTWGVRNVRLAEPPRILKDKHLKMVLCAGGSSMPAIAFNMGHREVGDGPLDVLFDLQQNEFRGIRTLQLNVRDFRAASADA